MQVRLERVWSILQVPVTCKLDWVIRYTGEEGCDLFEPALQAWEQAAAAVLERERSACMSHLLSLSEGDGDNNDGLENCFNFMVDSRMSQGTEGNGLPYPFSGLVLIAFT